MKLLGNTKSKITKDENGENVPHSEITETVLIHSNVLTIIINRCTFLPNKSFGKLRDILPNNFTFLKRFNAEFSYIEAWFTDQNSKLLEIEDKQTFLQLLIKV